MLDCNRDYDFRILPRVSALFVEKCIAICGVFMKTYDLVVISLYRSPSAHLTPLCESWSQLCVVQMWAV